jgi:hypothetical protein
MSLLPHARAKHMSIIHVLAYFSKLENRRKIIKKERIGRETSQSGKACEERDRVNMIRDLLCARKTLSEDLKQKATMPTSLS